MKATIITMVTFLLALNTAFAQHGNMAFSTGYTTENNLQIITTSNTNNLHIIAPEDIKYVDISAPWVQGDVTVSNICRLHADPDEFKKNGEYVITVVTQNFMFVRKIVYNRLASKQLNTNYAVKLDPEAAIPITARYELNKDDLLNTAYHGMMNLSEHKVAEKKDNGLIMTVTQLATKNDYIFIKVNLENKTKIPYTIDQVSLT